MVFNWLFRLRSISCLKQLFIISFCLLAVNSFAQNWAWAHGGGDIGNDAANSITFDDNGNSYVTGEFAGRSNFSGTMYQGRGLYEIFIAKYDLHGNIAWVKTAGGKGNDEGNAIKYSGGFIFITGFFSDTAWFENTMLISKGQTDAFTAKYDLNGNLIWVKQAGGTEADYGSSIDIDEGGNIYIAGTYQQAIGFDNVQLTTSNLYSESFFAKYSANGNLIWAKSTVGNGANLITGLAYDNHNSIFLTGFFGSNFTIGNLTVTTSTSSYDIFLAKIDENGNIQWLKRAGSDFEDAAHAVCSDKDGNPSITGYFAGTAYFDNHSVTYNDYNDIFVAHYDSMGNNLWVRAGKGPQLDVGFGITVDNNSNIFATGMFETTANFDGNILTAHGNLDRDIFLASYDVNGNIRWITSAGGSDTDCGLGVSVSNSGEVGICGFYLYTCSFGNIAIDYAQANDLFVAAYNPPVINSIPESLNDLEVSVYPNPCADNLQVSLPAGSTIRLFDSTGKQLYSSVSSYNYLLLNTSLFANGMYLLSVENKGNTALKKIIIYNGAN